ncbi:MAG: hypothetical protein BWK77_06835, partial [Verrucomicrobia bacterium A1]
MKKSFDEQSAMKTELKQSQAGRPAEDILRWALDEFHPDVALACSFSIEDIVVLDMLMEIRPDARVFAIDTGRLGEETLACAEAVRRRYNIPVAWYFPSREAVQELEGAKGLYSFRDSLQDRVE